MATWISKGDTSIGWHMIPERKKPVFGIMTGNQFVVYGQFHSKESAEEFMGKLVDLICTKRGTEDGK